MTVCCSVLARLAILECISPAVLSTYHANRASFWLLRIRLATEGYGRQPAMAHANGLTISGHHLWLRRVQYPVPATKEELEQEVRAVQEAVGELCPMHFTLERVLINSAGVVMACWQLSRGTSTTSLRATIKVRCCNWRT